MLCIQFIFTKEYFSYGEQLARDAKCLEHTCGLSTYCDLVEVEADAEDEGLYELCCIVSEYIKGKCIQSSVKRFLLSNYACFNSDECAVICTGVSERKFVSDIPGRMYIYLKIWGSINPFSFYTFMCRDIDALVCEVASEEAEKMLLARDNGDFISLLKSFADVSMANSDFVELTADSRGLRITSCRPATNDGTVEYSAEEEDILARLVTLNPGRISICGKEDFLKNDLSAVITAIFEDRIQYR